MRQKFDIGDLVRVVHPEGHRGIILERKLLNESITKEEDWSWHPDEYTCKIQFLHSKSISWVRAKWLEHLSKIN